MAFQLFYENRIWTEDELRSLAGENNYVIKLCSDWLNGKESFEFNTSGTTGAVKKIILRRDILEKSAKKTIKALNLEQNKHALLCMNPQFIGGSMIIIRSLIGNWKLTVVKPSRNINTENVAPGFIALAPLQFQAMMENPKSSKWLDECPAILLGGADLSPIQVSLSNNLSCPVYHSYGMTETASHIALKKLNGGSTAEYFSTMENIEIKTDPEGCLMIRGDVTDDQWISTSDTVKLHSAGTFEVLGRKDFVINSGGIKIHPEAVESAIYNVIGSRMSILVVGVPDPVLGEKAILLVEDITSLDWQHVLDTIDLELYSRPKEVVPVKKFIRTETDKINRNAMIASLQN